MCRRHVLVVNGQGQLRPARVWGRMWSLEVALWGEPRSGLGYRSSGVRVADGWIGVVVSKWRRSTDGRNHVGGEFRRSLE